MRPLVISYLFLPETIYHVKRVIVRKHSANKSERSYLLSPHILQPLIFLKQSGTKLEGWEMVS